MNIESKVLPHCWVCRVRFTDVVPPGPAQREEHHIVPQAYGGTDGPTVSLCDGHHTVIHKIAVALKNGRPHQAHLGTYDPQQIQKLMWLATVIQEAEAKTRNDPNKRASVVVNMDAETRNQLDALASVYPEARGRAALIKTAIKALYSRHYMK